VGAPGDIPPPTLSFLAHVVVEVGPPIVVGEAPEGLRRVVPILGGALRGPRLSGVILAAGADYQLLRPDGFTRLDARYVARLDDGGMVYIVNTGVRHGSGEAMAQIERGEPVDPEQIYFRTAPRFETTSPAHRWLTSALFVATGVRHLDRVELAIFEVG
jgi:hypothetical protein